VTVAKKLEIVKGADAPVADGYGAGAHRVDGHIASRLVSPPGFSLWMLQADLADGATIEWPETHGDEAVYVLDGGLDIEGRVVPPRGAAVVESDVVTRAQAVGPTRILHMGPADPAPPRDGINGPAATTGHGVHVVGPRGTYANTTDTVDSHYYADSTCPTCRITVLSVGRSHRWESAPHSHTQDELIHVVSGAITLGRRRVEPGDTLAIAADARYGFRGADDGFVFINYRRDASQQWLGHDKPLLLEGGAVNGLTPVMDLL
jgi:quercetin dioxygenase-like cupin family protein